MKTRNLSILFITLFSISLCGCDSSEKDKLMIRTALDSLKGESHNVLVEQTVTVLRHIPEGMTPEDPNWMYLPIDIHHEYSNKFTHYYGEDGERAYSREFNAVYCDLEKITGNPIKETVKYNNSPKEIFFKDELDGTIYTEEITFQNEYNSYTAAIYDETNGVYTPVIFDSEFINPFDFISSRDIVVRDDDRTKLTLINQKADYLSDSYGTVGMNFITDNTINLDENGRITSIDFYIEDLVDTDYTRKNTLTITYNRENVKIDHYQEFTHENEELQRALDVLDNKKNFTYIKKFEGPYMDTVKGYFTEDEVYFHHQVSEDDTHPYIKGDDYDYKCVKQEDGKYLCYEYVPDGEVFSWQVSKVSSTSDYIIDNFAGIGPSFMNFDASIFKKVDDKTYEIEEVLLPSSGHYFDNGMLGVQSGAFETNTSKLAIKLNDENEIEYIQANFIFEGIEYKIKFFIEDIDQTVIPEWADTDLTMPVPGYEE